ncbi:mammalian cell entry protein [Amycolatopsis albispora]|uniref:Mammalian cell entry protein n=2 Tax=Amycolatopsis albispora TaxID=1804986 RepID=A0A344LK42_9PSEU|nr:mammalian cell entry protein [Amycolatopsis albispora]
MLGLAAAVLLLTTAVLAPSGYFTATTDDFHAEVANASGLRVDDPVYVAGVPAGRVTGITLAGDRVDVAFRLDHDVPLGTTTRASIKLMTVLGRRYLGVEPAGPGRLAAGAVIPLDRTSVPYLLDDLGRNAQQATAELDLPRLREAIRTLGELTPEDPAQLGRALDGVSEVSTIVTENDTEIGRLLTGVQQLTDTLLAQKDKLVTLLGNADLVLRTITDRRDAIAAMLADVNELTAAATRLLSEHGPQFDTLLDQLHSITGKLSTSEQDLAKTVGQLAPASRYLANATGNGDWADVAGPAGPVPDNLLCVVGLVKGCR